MRYEFNILENVHRGPTPNAEPGEWTVGPSGWGNAVNALNMASSEGWELVQAQLHTRDYKDDSGNAWTEASVISLWRRVTDED